MGPLSIHPISYVESTLRNYRGKDNQVSKFYTLKNQAYLNKGMHFICCDFGEKQIQLQIPNGNALIAAML